MESGGLNALILGKGEGKKIGSADIKKSEKADLRFIRNQPDASVRPYLRGAKRKAGDTKAGTAIEREWGSAESKGEERIVRRANVSKSWLGRLLIISMGES